MHRNRLQGETSPYLLQHAGNPVDWFAWTDEALDKARAEDKPILLSIGYSACHWCHVMAHESFEDAATAAVMNARFVNIKVDREERPDIDRIYQIAQQLLSRAPGGWPLTMFLTPHGRQPYFGGTYFPKEAGYGLPAFRELLGRAADYYAANRDTIAAQAEPLRAAFAAVLPDGGPPGASLQPAPIDAARSALDASFDPQNGGFGGAPKFPHALRIERALRHWRSSAHLPQPDLGALYMVGLCLTRMAEGGIYDQIGGGWHRYAVDPKWEIPHFEKMLYDNGMLLSLYADAHLATGEALFARIAGETADWALRDMRSPEGAFYSSLDADAADGEGGSYLWDREEISSLLEAEEFAPFAARYGVDGPANFAGRWHLRVVEPLAEIGARLNREEAATEASIESARAKLLSRRTRRAQPGRDEKVLTAWNALLIRGLAIASRVLDRPELADAACAATDFIAERLWLDGRLFAVHAGGRARFAAYLDDHAFLADALLELLQTRWRSRDWNLLIDLAERLLADFEDGAAGGFFFTACDHETLLYRAKPFADESLPSGNGVAADLLSRLGSLSGEPRYLLAAQRTLSAALPLMSHHPEGHMGLINALQRRLQPQQTVVIRGAGREAERWARELRRVYAPQRLVLAIPDDEPRLPNAFADKPAVGSTVAYLCIGTTCSAPFGELQDLVRALRETPG